MAQDEGFIWCWMAGKGQCCLQTGGSPASLCWVSGPFWLRGESLTGGVDRVEGTLSLFSHVPLLKPLLLFLWVPHSHEGPHASYPLRSHEDSPGGVQLCIFLCRTDTLLAVSLQEELRAMILRASCPIVRSAEEQTA